MGIAPLPSIHKSQGMGGFTLVEVLVASVVGTLLIIATTTIVVPQLRMHQRLEGRTRLQERWARVQFLLDNEIQEAHTVRVNNNILELTICEPLAMDEFYAINANRCSNGGSAATGTPGNDATITYALDPSNQTLTRQGPSIDQRGSLVINTPSSSVLATGVLVFAPEARSQSVTYTLSFRDPADPNGATITNKSSAARARVKRF
jgi:type II secretory pathway component PulJ